jgi:hypothetical protein
MRGDAWMMTEMNGNVGKYLETMGGETLMGVLL